MQLELSEQQALVGIRFRVAAQEQLPAVGGGQIDIDHLQAGELLQHRARSQARAGQRAGLHTDLKAVGGESHEDMGFDALVLLMPDRSNSEIGLSSLERLLDIGQLNMQELPEFRRRLAFQVRSEASGGGLRAGAPAAA
ncbi:MAG: hypothetical protein IPK39_21635 [Sulfuritalea sp.]|nr:hypothetical protein [Sulfuritalea sp.]